MGTLKEPPVAAAKTGRPSGSTMLQEYRPQEGRRARAYATISLAMVELVLLLVLAAMVGPRLIPQLGALPASGLALVLWAALAWGTARLLNQPPWADRLILLERQAWFQIWLTGEIYKRNQGRKVRQLTFFGAVLLTALGVWRFSETILVGAKLGFWRYGLPALMLAVALWLSYRLVNVPRFADFLIATEAEMSKVSWPGWPELRRATAVVLVTVFLLTMALLFYDVVWQQLLTALGVLR